MSAKEMLAMGIFLGLLLGALGVLGGSICLWGFAIALCPARPQLPNCQPAFTLWD